MNRQQQKQKQEDIDGRMRSAVAVVERSCKTQDSLKRSAAGKCLGGSLH